MSFTVDILNNIRTNADAEYQARVPVATRENIAEIGRVLDQYTVQYNTFIDSLIHKIGFTMVQTDLFTNKLARFKSGQVLGMKDVEDIFVEAYRQAEGPYDANGGMDVNGIHPFKRRDYQDVKVNYYRMNRQDKYVITIYKDDVIRAFRSETALAQFITAQFNSLYTGANYDEYVHMKAILAESIADGKFKTYLVPEIKENGTEGAMQKACKSFIRTVKKAIADVSYPSTEFNPNGVKTHADKGQLVLFVHKDLQPHMDVDLYSQLFGPDYAKLGVEIVELDNFGADDNGTYALLCDKEIFKVYDTKNEMTQLFNPDGLYTNYWLHIWQILAISKFKTAIRFGTKDITPAGE